MKSKLVISFTLSSGESLSRSFMGKVIRRSRKVTKDSFEDSFGGGEATKKKPLYKYKDFLIFFIK